MVHRFENYNDLFGRFGYPCYAGPATGSGSVSATNSVRGTFQNSDTLVPLDRSLNITLPPGVTWAQVTNITVTVNVDHQRDQEVEMYLVAPNAAGACGAGFKPPFIKNTPSAPYPTYSQIYNPQWVIPLVNSQGGTGRNFTNTIFSDAAGGVSTLRSWQ